MSKERELLRRALDDLELQVGRSIDEIRAYLNQSEIPTGCTLSDDAEEPVYLARRKGLDDFFTCSKDRYDELSALDLFETKIAFLNPPKPEPAARKPMTEEEIFDLIKGNNLYCKVSFVCGIQAAEKHHEIGEDD